MAMAVSSLLWTPLSHHQLDRTWSLSAPLLSMTQMWPGKPLASGRHPVPSLLHLNGWSCVHSQDSPSLCKLPVPTSNPVMHSGCFPPSVPPRNPAPSWFPGAITCPKQLCTADLTKIWREVTLQHSLHATIFTFTLEPMSIPAFSRVLLAHPSQLDDRLFDARPEALFASLLACFDGIMFVKL